jgi:hemerythrin-like domain-containing protein
MKATSLLEKQHRKVEGIFKKLEAGKEDPKPLLQELADDLAAHMAIEQDLFYPAVKSVDEDVIGEAFEEHAVAEIALRRLLATDPSDESFQAKVTTLKELIEHHVEEEEEELFPKVEKALDKEALSILGDEMKAAFEAALAEGHEALLPDDLSTTTADQARTGSSEVANEMEAPASH